ncbi:carbon-nitrogen hydrolase family protein [Cytophaga sp. FL35]|uniref:carbon-nitrogen hydrolase family protein n=1 Tax=Cytophaga sp. FL35 TaxID=1904456 RepID=UPI001653CBD1|nr:carbon-nitrogen hydrolase family protein [Cytophaga sp. FL35]MBC6998804.1 carbon-nitrogen hydrolase family protein [Cytophaga sp. FL35]
MVVKIALAQIQPHRGSIAKNIELHIQCIKLASKNEAEAIFFPELSLSGYEPKLAKDLKIKPEDHRLLPLQRLSNRLNMTIGLGAPLDSNNGVQIALLIFQPNKAISVYAKQWLHDDEKPFFKPGRNYGHIELNNKHISLAICYESLRNEHLQQALLHQPDFYLACTAKAQKGVDKAEKHFERISKAHKLGVLFCNSVGPADDFIGAGSSAVWSADGKLLVQLTKDEQGLLIFDTESNTCENIFIHQNELS